jgi:hypothetical protein
LWARLTCWYISDAPVSETSKTVVCDAPFTVVGAA